MIDYDRGVAKRKAPGGVSVYMYNDSPGHYYNAYGTEVDESLAKAAGFPVERLRKERAKQERMTQAKDLIEKEFASAPGEIKVVAKKGDFSLVDIGLGRFQVRDPDGTPLNTQHVSKDIGQQLLAAMAGGGDGKKAGRKSQSARQEGEPDGS